MSPKNQSQPHAHFLPETNGWPNSWSEPEKESPFSRAILITFLPFIHSELLGNYSEPTLRKHLYSLWLIGKGIVNSNKGNTKLPKAPMTEIVLSFIECHNLPVEIHFDERAQKSYEITCRRLYRFLNEPFRVY
jgi:hypothetical protein